MLIRALDWFASPTGQKVNYYFDVAHSVITLAILPSTEAFPVLWRVSPIMTCTIMGLAVYSLVCAQIYYSKNYRN